MLPQPAEDADEVAQGGYLACGGQESHCHQTRARRVGMCGAAPPNRHASVRQHGRPDCADTAARGRAVRGAGLGARQRLGPWKRPVVA